MEIHYLNINKEKFTRFQSHAGEPLCNDYVGSLETGKICMKLIYRPETDTLDGEVYVLDPRTGYGQLPDGRSYEHSGGVCLGFRDISFDDFRKQAELVLSKYIDDNGLSEKADCSQESKREQQRLSLFRQILQRGITYV